MSRRSLRALAFVLGVVVGGRGCQEVDDGYCAPMTLEGIPTGSFPINSSSPIGIPGIIEIYEDRVELEVNHPTHGMVYATYDRPPHR